MPSQELNLLARLAVAAQVERPALLSSIEMLRRVEDSLQLLREGKLSTGGFKLHEDNLLVLSGLCALVTDSDRGSVTSRLADSGALCDFLEELPWPEDEFGEREEMLRQCAFSAWRNARVLGNRQAVAKWRRRYAQSLWRDIAARELLEYILQLHAERSDDLDDETVFAICLLLKGEPFDAAATASKASSLFARLSAPSPVVGIADEREYFLAYRLISQASWLDEFGEREEMLCRCAFLAWRSARLQGKAAESVLWSERFRATLARPSPVAYRAARFFATPIAERSESFKRENLLDPEALLSICGLLWHLRDSSPVTLAKEASFIHCWLASCDRDHFFGDELDFFLGETACLASTGYRQLGNRAEVLRWLELATASFRRTTCSEVGLANVAYVRLALRFEMGCYEDVFDMLPSLRSAFEQLGMHRETAKCRLVEAMALKNLSRVSEALEVLEPVCNGAVLGEDRVLHGRFLVELGDLLQLDGRLDAAVMAYRKALPLLQGAGLSIPLADLKLVIAAAFRAQGRLAQAIEAFRAAQRDYETLGTIGQVAYLHLLVAEAFLALDHDREAEREILAALPTIEEQKMVPQGFAAVALLRESVRRQKTDPEALRQLREHLQAKGEKE